MEGVPTVFEKLLIWLDTFFEYVKSSGENSFMIIERSRFLENNAPKEDVLFFAGSLVLMLVISVFACDSFRIFSPINGLKEWKSKISIVKVIVFAATVFSIHIFYKMTVNAISGIIGSDASIRALDCLGSYINPLAIMIYAFALSTLNLRRGRFQAFMLGLECFFLPSAMTFIGFTKEHVAIYVAALVIGLAGAVVYKSFSILINCFSLYVVYFIVKFFMISYSEQAELITSNDFFGRLSQYFACIRTELIIAFVLLVILYVYTIMVTDGVNVLKNLAFPAVFALLFGISLLFGGGVNSFEQDYQEALGLLGKGEYQLAMDAFEALGDYSDSSKYYMESYEKLCSQTYDEAVDYMQQEEYEKAAELFTSIKDYSDSADKLSECKEFLHQKLVGAWQGSSGTRLILNADGTCYMKNRSQWSTDGTWRVWKDVLYISTPIFSADLYAKLTDGYNVTSISVDSDDSRWSDGEVYERLLDFNADSEDRANLEGEWRGESGSIFTLNADGTCYYVDGNSGEGSGTWYVTDSAMLCVNTEGLSYEIYGFLNNGYLTAQITMISDDSGWNDEIFTKQ